MTRPTLVVAIALPLLLAVVVAVLALVTDDHAAEQPPRPDGPLALPAVAAPAAASAECRALLERLPSELAATGSRLPRRELAEPAPPATAAWGSGLHPATLRCGIERPAELTRTAPLLDVSGVRWLRLRGDGASTWVAVDRRVYVGLTYGDDAGTGPLQDVSATIAATLDVQRVQPNP